MPILSAFLYGKLGPSYHESHEANTLISVSLWER